MRKKYIVQLTEEEREYLHKLISSGTAPARKLNRARILLKADVGEHAEGEALIDKEIAQMVETSPAHSRSEEHTSELQSRQYLVCRLLLEKKKQLWPHPRKLL